MTISKYYRQLNPVVTEKVNHVERMRAHLRQDKVQNVHESFKQAAFDMEEVIVAAVVPMRCSHS